MIVVTGATGHLGRLVIDGLLKKVPASEIVAAVRAPEKAHDLAERGVEVRMADYKQPQSLETALQGAAKLLLISSNDIGHYEVQHKAVLDAAKRAGIGFVAYTSLLHADTSPLKIAVEHLATERYLRASGLAFSLLRNGWYFENQTAAIPFAIENGAFVGASGDGRYAAAARADYAAAAVAVLTGEGHDNTVYELGGDFPYTRSELAAEVSKQVGKKVVYRNLPGEEYEKILAKFVPPVAAHVIADAEANAAAGALDDSSHTLSRLIGRKTTLLAEAVADALKTPVAAH
jgi:NAD(P)H dehydrogenase (quinone)